MSNRHHRHRQGTTHDRTRRFANGHRHDLVDAINCDDCREEAVEAAVGNPLWFLLVFHREPEPGETGTPFMCGLCSDVHFAGPLVGLTAVPSWLADPGDAIATSLAMDGNPGGILSVKRVPRRLVHRAGLQPFTLVTEPEATPALAALERA